MLNYTYDVTVEYVDYDFDEEDPRKVHITVVLKLWARVTTTADMDVYTMTPVDELGVTENSTASASSDGMYSASQSGEAVVSASHPGGESVIVTGPGFEPTAGTNMAASGTATVTGNSVNVRTGPGTNFPVITKVNKGDTVTIKDQAFGWYKVVLKDGTTGWIASWLVNITSGAKG